MGHGHKSVSNRGVLLWLEASLNLFISALIQLEENMITIKKLPRPVVLSLAAVVTALTFVVVANATQTITTPNAALVTYALGAGGISVPIVPTPGRPVLVMGVNTTIGNRGVGQVTLLRSGIAPLFLEWVGLESTAGAVITQGFSAVPGTHIVFLDFAHTVGIEVNTGDTMRIHNTGGAAQAGNVTLIW